MAATNAITAKIASVMAVVCSVGISIKFKFLPGDKIYRVLLRVHVFLHSGVAYMDVGRGRKPLKIARNKNLFRAKVSIYEMLTRMNCKAALPFGVKSQINAEKFKIAVTQKIALKGCL